ncbi:uncharacterized protein LOC110835231 isoform X2 [Zootermopsis nevadensis]|uniref:uncharacterized protein LOC110835231 isoform X2 n=1 Tax=Zootermopsis nevadensis TaxID=136037 RepID=UPI000B8E88AF|nr:uncharacterized protein LOC110835231 isoform X2 [Zootermopsis nevadensis]
MSVSEGQCILNNEQMNARMDLKKLGQHGVMQVQDYSMNLCSLRTITHITNNKSYGTLTSVEFDYQQKQVRLLFSMGANCTVTERYKSQLLLNCDEDAGSREPRVLMENDCGVVIEWLNANVCDVLVPSSVHTTLRSESTSGSSVGLVVGLIILAAVLCLLVLHFRKPANRSQLRSWVYSFLGMRRHNGQFHYSLENDGVWSEL